MLARRLLTARGGSGSFTPPTPTPGVVQITATPQGSSTVVQQPWAVYDSVADRYVFAYIRGDNGNVEVVSYNHNTDTTSSAVVLHASFQADNHASPALILLDSGYWFCAYTRHQSFPIYYRRSTNPHDISAWDTEGSNSQGGTTYPTLIQLTGETDSPLYMFFRWFHGSTATLTYVKSTDEGATWASSVQVYEGPTVYWHLTTNGVDRIDFAVTDVAPQPISGGLAADIGHFYYEGGSYFQTDGTSIGGGLPMTFSDVTPVIDGATVGGGCFPFNVSEIGPTIAVNVYLAGTGVIDNAYYDCRWTGSAWQVTLITNAGSSFYGGQATGLSLDQGDPDHYVCGLKVGGNWNMYAYSSPDNGVTWVPGDQLTATAAPTLHIWPTCIWNHPPGGLITAWIAGDNYTSDVNWDTGITAVDQ